MLQAPACPERRAEATQACYASISTDMTLRKMIWLGLAMLLPLLIGVGVADDEQRSALGDLPLRVIQPFIRLYQSTTDSLPGLRNSSVGSATEDTLSVYTGLPLSQISSLLSLFQTEYPDISVTVVHDTSASRLSQQLLAERADPKADVVWGLAVTSVMFLSWHNLLIRYTPVGLERLREQFRDRANPPHWVGFEAWTIALCVNTDRLKTLGLPQPQTVRDLSKEVYAGQLAMPHPAASDTGYLAISSVLEQHGEDAGWALLTALTQNIAQYTQSDREACQLTAQVQVPIGLSSGVAAIAHTQPGGPVSIVFPGGGLTWDMEVSALIRKDPIKPAAKTFLNWVISDTAMRAYAQDYAITAVQTPDPPPTGFPPQPFTQLLARDFPWAAANRERILREWQLRYGEPPLSQAEGQRSETPD